ncbi:MAG: GTP cyclohydrolase II [Anaerolineae bacterium]|nr:GTP cyclohydrolase II [Anaerolineae bacterium]
MSNSPDGQPLTIKRMVCATIPTTHGDFQLCLYHNNHDSKEHLAFIFGDIANQENILTRMHSECFTGDVLGSQRCDCGQQLAASMRMISEVGKGIIIYLRQEGRGIGLLEKLRAYNLQDQGYDTVDANLMLGHQADEREYSIAPLILCDWGVKSIRLLTNNPSKIDSLRELGVLVTERVPIETPILPNSANYMLTKMLRMNHLLTLSNGHHPA